MPPGLRSRIGAIIALGVLLAAGWAAAARAQPAPRPQLVVVVSVDQLSSDLFAAFRARYRDGLATLLGRAVVFPRGHHPQAITETCPGHAAILTGGYPWRTGIVANGWYDRDRDRPVNCAEDPDAATPPGDPYRRSAVQLRLPTLGDRLKRLAPRTRVVAVAGKDRAALMLGGQRADELWYWDRDRFEGHGSATAVVGRANARVARVLARPDPMPLPRACRADALPVALPGLSVGVPAPRAAGDRDHFLRTPALDAAVTDLAIDLLESLRLGTGDTTDILAIGLSATDYIGHAYGTAGGEMCQQQLALDRAVGRLVAALDRAGRRYLLVLTADHGGIDIPERTRDNGIPARRAAPDPFDLAQMFALDSAPAGPGGSFHRDGLTFTLRGRVAPAQRASLLEALKLRLLRERDVAAVFLAEELRAMAPATGSPERWTLAERARASYAAGRSGDLLVVLQPRVSAFARPARFGTTGHGSPWDYDRHVPILFAGTGLRPFEQPFGVEVVDIMPTIASLLGLAVPGDEIDGRCRDIVAGAASNCPPAAQPRGGRP